MRIFRETKNILKSKLGLVNLFKGMSLFGQKKRHESIGYFVMSPFTYLKMYFF